MSSTSWLIIGFAGQALFSVRFVIQWLASEKLKKSVIPTAFWYFSMVGSLTLLSYALYKRDPVFVLGQSFGVLIYLRNLYFINPATAKRLVFIIMAYFIALLSYLFFSGSIHPEYLKQLRNNNSSKDNFWQVIGFIGQIMFSLRFIVQWLVSEKNKKSIMPVSFWYFSLFGSVSLLSYAIYQQDPVFITGQSFGMLVYLRNLYFIKRNNA